MESPSPPVRGPQVHPSPYCDQQWQWPPDPLPGPSSKYRRLSSENPLNTSNARADPRVSSHYFRRLVPGPASLTRGRMNLGEPQHERPQLRNPPTPLRTLQQPSEPPLTRSGDPRGSPSQGGLAERRSSHPRLLQVPRPEKAERRQLRHHLYAKYPSKSVHPCRRHQEELELPADPVQANCISDLSIQGQTVKPLTAAVG